MAKKGGYGGTNGEVDFLKFDNDGRGDKGAQGMGLPEYNDYRGSMGGAGGTPLFNDYRARDPGTGSVMNAPFDRPVSAS